MGVILGLISGGRLFPVSLCRARRLSCCSGGREIGSVGAGAGVDVDMDVDVVRKSSGGCEGTGETQRERESRECEMESEVMRQAQTDRRCPSVAPHQRGEKGNASNQQSCAAFPNEMDGKAQECGHAGRRRAFEDVSPSLSSRRFLVLLGSAKFTSHMHSGCCQSSSLSL